MAKRPPRAAASSASATTSPRELEDELLPATANAFLEATHELFLARPWETLPASARTLWISDQAHTLCAGVTIASSASGPTLTIYDSPEQLGEDDHDEILRFVPFAKLPPLVRQRVQRAGLHEPLRDAYAVLQDAEGEDVPDWHYPFHIALAKTLVGALARKDELVAAIEHGGHFLHAETHDVQGEPRQIAVLSPVDVATAKLSVADLLRALAQLPQDKHRGTSDSLYELHRVLLSRYVGAEQQGEADRGTLDDALYFLGDRLGQSLARATHEELQAALFDGGRGPLLKPRAEAFQRLFRWLEAETRDARWDGLALAVAPTEPAMVAALATQPAEEWATRVQSGAHPFLDRLRQGGGASLPAAITRKPVLDPEAARALKNKQKAARKAQKKGK